jgi:hypothetical protein
MKISKLFICCLFLLLTVSSLKAGEVILYGGAQKPGQLSFSTEDAEVAKDMLDGGFGSTFGLRFSGGRFLGFEQNISFSPRFARGGVHAFQMDTNLVLQAPGKVTPYATAGIGFIYTWGQNYPEDLDPAKIASFAFNFGREFAFNYGGGIKLRRALGPVGLNFDVRGYTIPSARDGSLNFIQTSIGMVFNF